MNRDDDHDLAISIFLREPCMLDLLGELIPTWLIFLFDIVVHAKEEPNFYITTRNRERKWPTPTKIQLKLMRYESPFNSIRRPSRDGGIVCIESEQVLEIP